MKFPYHLLLTTYYYSAETEGFEPSIPFRIYTLSRRAPSTTRTNLQRIAKLQIIGHKFSDLFLMHKLSINYLGCLIISYPLLLTPYPLPLPTTSKITAQALLISSSFIINGGAIRIQFDANKNQSVKMPFSIHESMIALF